MVRVRKCVLGALPILCGIPALASAQAYGPHYDVTELHSASATGSGPGSFAAAAMMGAEGFGGLIPPANWENSMVSLCASLSGSTQWLAGCNPTGMTQALKQYSTDSWLLDTFPASQQPAALDAVLSGLKFYGSPIVLPIDGQADHWVTVTEVTVMVTNGVESISQVFLYDGGNPGKLDSGGNAYFGGQQVFSGRIFAKSYFCIITAINPQCDAHGGCVSDPFYNQFVVISEPPPGPRLHAQAEYPKSPSVLPPGLMSPRMARTHLWHALSLAGLNANQAVWSAISRGEPGDGLLVNGTFPDGSAWNYYLVPIFVGPDLVTAFAQLSADDGAFEGLRLLPAPARFAPLSLENARTSAKDMLDAGESLHGGALRRDPRAPGNIARSPILPYYEFDIMSGGRRVGAARIALDNSMVARD